jgi:hypothetical protein
MEDIEQFKHRIRFTIIMCIHLTFLWFTKHRINQPAESQSEWLWYPLILPGFQKGRNIKASQGNGQGAVLAKKGQFVSYKEKLLKRTEFHLFRVNKMFSHKF